MYGTRCKFSFPSSAFPSWASLTTEELSRLLTDQYEHGDTPLSGESSRGEELNNVGKRRLCTKQGRKFPPKKEESMASQEHGGARWDGTGRGHGQHVAEEPVPASVRGHGFGGSFVVTVELPSPGGQQEGQLLSALAAPAANFSWVHDPVEELPTGCVWCGRSSWGSPPARWGSTAQGSAPSRGKVPPTC